MSIKAAAGIDFLCSYSDELGGTGDIDAERRVGWCRACLLVRISMKTTAWEERNGGVVMGKFLVPEYREPREEKSRMLRGEPSGYNCGGVNLCD